MNYNINPYTPYTEQQYTFNQPQQYSFGQQFQQLNQPQQPQQLYQNDGTMIAVFVKGEAGARAYPVASGNAVLLIDLESGHLWIKSKVNGFPEDFRSFTIVEEQKQEENVSENVTRDEFNQLSQNVTSLAENVSRLIKELGGSNE